MTDPFDTLGVEPRFDLDLRALEQRHRDLSRALHPDRYAGAPAAERRLALGRAIETNDALRVLRDPIRRAEALLQRAGLARGEETQQKASPALLMEMMESREELSEAARKRDRARVARLGDAMRAREQATLATIGRAFAAAGGEAAQLKGVLAMLSELRYIRRFLDEVSAIEEELTDPI
ncbi:Fe-S protein assembly co-chaperone HscB [Sorangium cellulosum]|uniref:Co-chaperone protein HscB homolog n=1 Tax=Sorangium cellulosum TaxID=56 RepID=A0A2L0F6F2_SORCE|nr:Fe-S protein assembly co-chaperone HscB [Sorangium cellulosum]AUX47168.1 Fe-S protein assembly co-chaperone HscB [Sorangium cellulosum]